MAGPYYVDVDNPGAWNGRTGLDHTGNEWLGLSGLQYVLDTITSGNGPTYVKGAASDGTTLKSLTCNNQVGNFIRGEAVTWDAGASNGVVSEIDGGNLPIVIEVIGGVLANLDNLVGTTSGATADVNGAPTTKTIIMDVDTNAGSSTTAKIKFIGVASDWSVDGTRAVIDAKGGNNNCINHNVPFVWLENFELDDGNTDNVVLGSSSDSSVYVNCISHDAGADGFAVDNNANAMMYIRTQSYNNTNWGWDGYGGNNKWVACTAYGNGDGAFDTGYAVGKVLDGFVAHDNGNNDNNIEMYRYDYISHSVVDGTDQTGETGIIDVIGDSNLVIFNRITNLNEGLDAGSRSDVFGFNLFHNCTTDTTNATLLDPIPLDSTTDTNKYDPDADDGYNAKATDDFNLKASRTYNGDGNDVLDMNIGS